MTKEQLQEYALYAEIAASFAVLITLVILVLEVRENTEVTRSSAYRDINTQQNEFRTKMISDENLYPVFQAFMSGESENISSSDSTRMTSIILTMFAIYEDAYYSYDYGIIGEREWARFVPGICRQYQRAVAQGMENVVNALTPAFAEQVVQFCAD